MRRPIWLIIAHLVALLQPACGKTAENQDWEAFFSDANQAYKEARFQEAADGYEQLVRSGYEDGILYYNLGNAYFRLNQIGRAILNYERARLIIPRDEDLNFNLRHAQVLIEDVIPESRGLESMKLFWLDHLSVDELFWGLAILNVLFWAVLWIRLCLRADWNYYLFLVLLIFWVIGGLSYGLKWYLVETDDRAVVLEQELNVLAGPDPDDTLLFMLHAGTIVHHERSENGWHLVSLPGEKRGWVQHEAIERIKR